MKVTIKQNQKSKQFRFVFIADNGKKLDPRDSYHNKKDIEKMLKKYFPQFPIEDLTKKISPAKTRKH